MRPKLQFVSTGVVINTENASVFVGQGPFKANVHASTEDGTVHGAHSEIAVAKKKSGFVFTLPDSTIAVVFKPVDKKEAKEYAADVIVLARKEEHLLTVIKPKLAVLRSTMYDARDLASKTTVQVVAAKTNDVIDLFTYSAVGEQKALSKFTQLQK